MIAIQKMMNFIKPPHVWISNNTIGSFVTIINDFLKILVGFCHLWHCKKKPRTLSGRIESLIFNLRNATKKLTFSYGRNLSQKVKFFVANDFVTDPKFVIIMGVINQ